MSGARQFSELMEKFTPERKENIRKRVQHMLKKMAKEEARTHALPCRVYYEDTDAGGVVYYARYLAFAERARTEFLRAAVGRAGPLWTQEDPLFVVRHLEADYKASARLDDLLVVTTELERLGGASLTMLQCIKRGEDVLVAIKVTLVTVTHEGKVLRLPPEWRQKLEALGLTAESRGG